MYIFSIILGLHNIYYRGGQTVAREPHAVLQTLAGGSLNVLKIEKVYGKSENDLMQQPFFCREYHDFGTRIKKYRIDSR